MQNRESKKKSETLLNCPFCGGEARFANVIGRTGVVCKDCFAEMRGYLDMTPEEMKRYWNTRKPMDRIVEELGSQCSKTVSMGRMDGKTLTAGFYLGILNAIEIVKEGGKDV